MLFEESEILVVKKGQLIYKQKAAVKEVFFVLYGALQVTFNTGNGINIGDVVRGGNVVGEEGFFLKVPKYKESVKCLSKDAALMRISAASLSQIG
jgi:CRP-like cAMP-binding protein